jgi:hypothetical protein
MRKINLFSGLLLSIVILSSCDKDEAVPPAEEYLVVGRVNTARSNIAGSVTTATFTVKYNEPDAFGQPAGSISGTLNWTGLPSNADSAAVYAFSATELNYLVGTAANASSKVHTFTNGTAGSLTLNLPLTAIGAKPFTNGAGYIRLGKNNNYLFVALDNVTKIK